MTSPSRMLTGVFPLAAILSFLATVALFPPGMGAQNSNREIRIKPLESRLPESSKRWALVIGVNDYEDPQIPSLAGAVNDAKAISKALIEYAGFPEDQVILLASDQPVERLPNRGNILQRLSNLKSLVPEDGLLLISFAGHGIDRAGRAYLLPSNARSNDDVFLLANTSIPVDVIRDMISDAQMKQVIIILDACRNEPGGRSDSINPLTKAYTRGFDFAARNQDIKAFVTLYATQIGDRAYEYTEKKHGYFTWFLVEGLSGKAANPQGEVTLRSLMQYLEVQVPKRIAIDLGRGKRQKPWADSTGFNSQELVISVIPRPAIADDSNKPKAGPSKSEERFWDSIKDSSDPEDYREYLKIYPNGTFAVVASRNLRKLEAAAKEPESKEEAPSLAKGNNKDGSDTASSPKPLPVEPAGHRASEVNASRSPFSFDTIVLDDHGKTLSRKQAQALSFVDDLGGGAKIEMVEIPQGTFTMGSPDFESKRGGNEGPLHLVTLKNFAMSKHEITQAQWRAVANLKKVSIDLNPDPSKFKGDGLPVENVSWEEAAEFCERLSKSTGRKYRLPSEAEWEYACRAGTTTPFYLGGTITIGLANYDGTFPYKSAPKGVNRQRTVVVGFIGVPNMFGLFDMHGNVSEWCADEWFEDYNDAPGDGSARAGINKTDYRVVRGGNWYDQARDVRSAARGYFPRRHRSHSLGFRVVIAP
jgi:formylglycine-generating enzyme required for sulfatase activity